MTTKQFIEKMIEGGWKAELKFGQAFRIEPELKVGGRLIPDAEVFLDPKAWEAVGKVEGWREATHIVKEDMTDEWQDKMHQMIDALIGGSSIKKYIKTL